MCKNLGYYAAAGLSVLLLHAADICFASFLDEDNKKDLFFILEPQTSTVVVTTMLPDDVRGSVMRLPDLSLDASGEMAAEATRGTPDMESKIQSIKKTEIPGKDLAAALPMKFKPRNIVGTVKLPKVEFGNLRPSINLREEMPSIDFTSKSLKDGGL